MPRVDTKEIEMRLLEDLKIVVKDPNGLVICCIDVTVTLKGEILFENDYFIELGKTIVDEIRDADNPEAIKLGKEGWIKR